MKHDTLDQYSGYDLQLPEMALLTAWDCLAPFQEDLVLVGGLAVKALTHPPEGGLPGPVTLDVDFGINIAASAGMYGSIRETLSGHGFKWDEAKCRFMRKFDSMDLCIDLLTDDGASEMGGAIVDDSLSVSVIPGIERALQMHREIRFEGLTLIGANASSRVRVAEVGPMLALKLNAFGGPLTGRKVPKDAHDIAYLALNYLNGTEQAVAAFHKERAANNRAIPYAIYALTNHFTSADSLGPLSCAAFRLNNRHLDPELRDESMQIRQQCVTLAQAFLA